MRILAVDPGTRKAGIAIAEIVASEAQLLYRAILSLEELVPHMRLILETYRPDHLLVGASTGSQRVLKLLRESFPERTWEVVEERETTLLARELYFRYHPPRGWRRLLPKGLRVPPEPYDDYAALALILRAINEPQLPE